jgi:large subunit ribosomal protein L13
MKTIDAEKKKIGRVATEAAMALMGKDQADYTPNVLTKITVHITNASKVDVTTKKLSEKEYKKFSGYPGGLKHEPMKKIIEKKGYEEIFKKAVRGMLPNNRLRPLMLKNLKVTE